MHDRAPDRAHDRPRLERRTVDHQGRTRKFLVINGGCDDLVLFFHGSMQSGSVIRRFTAGTFDRLPATVVYPDGYRNHFNDARATLPVAAREENIDDVGFTRKIIEELAPRRVFAAGYSNGGQFVIRLLFDAPSLLTAAAIFASTLGKGDNHAPTNPDSAYIPTPVMFVHGTADRLAPYGGGHAGFDRQRSRGEVLSAPATAARFVQLNGLDTEHGPHEHQVFADTTLSWWDPPAAPTGRAHSPAPVELWSVEGMGHVIPSGNEVDARLGKNTDSFIAADLVGDFFGLA